MHLPIVGSIDSFLAAAAMVVAGCPRSWRRTVIVGFAAFDMVAALTSVPVNPTTTALIVAFAILAAALVIVRARKYPVLFLIVPVLLSADNLVFSTFGIRTSLLSALIDGVSSGVMAAAGFVATTLVARSARNTMEGAER
jgi:hypothetical protein